jgi:hypothetical protein
MRCFLSCYFQSGLFSKLTISKWLQFLCCFKFWYEKQHILKSAASKTAHFDISCGRCRCFLDRIVIIWTVPIHWIPEHYERLDKLVTLFSTIRTVLHYYGRGNRKSVHAQTKMIIARQKQNITVISNLYSIALSIYFNMKHMKTLPFLANIFYSFYKNKISGRNLKISTCYYQLIFLPYENTHYYNNNRKKI